MRLTRLELHGFKSFADATALTFTDGVTAIVGPNGCGKSNVSDAVRWVLGEQRARLLRGAKMEEVIFQGSSARRAVQLAEVSLAFANDDGALPVPFREVVITRRLSRSGESEYLLNGAACRLRDIHDLVRGTGLGADSGVVIEQKMIDALLSDRPDERRELFEEAAGVSLYRDRRRTTERRLEETATDLARLDDLLGEVTNQVRSLARQRKRAERHHELTQRRFALELTVARREMAGWADELTALDARVAALRAEVPRLGEAVAAATRRRDAAHQGRAAAEAARAELARLAAEQRDRVRDLEQEVLVAEERQRNAEAQAAQREVERREEAVVEDRVAHAFVDAQGARAAAEAALAAATETLRARTAAEEATRHDVAAARTAVARAEDDARAERERARALELERERADRERTEVGQRLATLAQELAALRDGVAAAARDATATAEAATLAQDAATAAQAALEAARAAALAATAADVAARDDARRAEEAWTALRGKVDALDALDRERVGLAPAAARLLRERGAFGDGVLGPLTDFIGADAEAALLVERYLGASMHAVVVRDAVAAAAVQAWHRREDPGPLLLLPLDALAPDGEPPAADALAGRVRAESVAARWVHTLLGGVRPLDGGTAFRDARGAVWLPGDATGAGPLRRRAELETLRAALADAAASAAEREATAAFAGATATQRALHDAQARHAEAARLHERAARDVHDAEGAIARLGARRSELGDTLASVDAGARDVAAALATHEAAIAAARAAFAAAEDAHEAAREARTAATIAHGQRTAELQVAADREGRLAAERATATQRLDALAAELARLTEAGAAVARQMAAWRLDLESRRASLADVDARLAAAERRVAEADQGLHAADHALDEARGAEHEAADALHLAELRHADLASRRSVIQGRLEAEWRRPLAELFAGFAPVEGDDATVRADAEEVRQQLEALGPVNPLAVEEHEEELKRLDFLTQQRADLGEAQRTLQQAIREIDSTARDLFLGTFAAVRENFRQIFLTLFGGGECDLRLEDPERPLDCDIEIHAAPRGKRTQRIHLLSSGERALVALSLLFGIFLSKPSPFCLLDEVDAPLDDANIGRFVRMLNEFKQKTQFIVITHNPRTTTEAADAVYGVTMQEPGVSSLVSVRMTGRPVDDEDPAASGAAA